MVCFRRCLGLLESLAAGFSCPCWPSVNGVTGAEKFDLCAEMPGALLYHYDHVDRSLARLADRKGLEMPVVIESASGWRQVSDYLIRV